MKASEAMRRELIAAWEDSETVEEAALNIQNVIDRFAPAGLPIEERTWGGWDLNPYSNPEKCGLSLLATAEEHAAVDFGRAIKAGEFVVQNAGQKHEAISLLIGVTHRSRIILILRQIICLQYLQQKRNRRFIFLRGYTH